MIRSTIRDVDEILDDISHERTLQSPVKAGQCKLQEKALSSCIFRRDWEYRMINKKEGNSNENDNASS